MTPDDEAAFAGLVRLVELELAAQVLAELVARERAEPGSIPDVAIEAIGG